MHEHLKPATIWESMGINSQEDYIEKYITIGKFHENVPEVIQSDYEIVEHLQFFSYYKFPLIDEAFGKSTRIFEASVDMKIEDFGMQKEHFDSLTSKIKRLEKHTSAELNQQWLHSKKIRNVFAHHRAGRLMGITLLGGIFKHNINMINSVFLTKEEIIKKETSLKTISQNATHLNKGLFIMTYKEKRFLIWSIIPYSKSSINGIEKSFWAFHPVYREKTITKTSDFPSPFFLNLKNVEISAIGLSAQVLETEELINVVATDKTMNKDQYNLHLKQMIDIDLELKLMYQTIIKSKLNKGITEFIYNYQWK